MNNILSLHEMLDCAVKQVKSKKKVSKTDAQVVLAKEMDISVSSLRDYMKEGKTITSMKNWLKVVAYFERKGLIELRKETFMSYYEQFSNRNAGRLSFKDGLERFSQSIISRDNKINNSYIPHEKIIKSAIRLAYEYDKNFTLKNCSQINHEEILEVLKKIESKLVKEKILYKLLDSKNENKILLTDLINKILSTIFGLNTDFFGDGCEDKRRISETITFSLERLHDKRLHMATGYDRYFILNEQVVKQVIDTILQAISDVIFWHESMNSSFSASFPNKSELIKELDINTIGTWIKIKHFVSRFILRTNEIQEVNSKIDKLDNNQYSNSIQQYVPSVRERNKLSTMMADLEKLFSKNKSELIILNQIVKEGSVLHLRNEVVAIFFKELYSELEAHLEDLFSESTELELKVKSFKKKVSKKLNIYDPQRIPLTSYIVPATEKIIEALIYINSLPTDSLSHNIMELSKILRGTTIYDYEFGEALNFIAQKRKSHLKKFIKDKLVFPEDHPIGMIQKYIDEANVEKDFLIKIKSELDHLILDENKVTEIQLFFEELTEFNSLSIETKIVEVIQGVIKEYPQCENDKDIRKIKDLLMCIDNKKCVTTPCSPSEYRVVKALEFLNEKKEMLVESIFFDLKKILSYRIVPKEVGIEKMPPDPFC